MRIYLLVALLSFTPTCAYAQVLYEAVIDERLESVFTMRTFDNTYAADFAKAEELIVDSAEFGEFRLRILPGSNRARGVIPFSRWTIKGIVAEGNRIAGPFARRQAREQLIHDADLSQPWLGRDDRRVGPLSGARRTCRPKASIPLQPGGRGNGEFALLLTEQGRFIDQYYRRPSQSLTHASVDCGSYSGKAYLHYRLFRADPPVAASPKRGR